MKLLLFYRPILAKFQSRSTSLPNLKINHLHEQNVEIRKRGHFREIKGREIYCQRSGGHFESHAHQERCKRCNVVLLSSPFRLSLISARCSNVKLRRNEESQQRGSNAITRPRLRAFLFSSPRGREFIVSSLARTHSITR